ncbi:MAG: hypothetical protein K2J95_01650 [Lachnospiraceae bacterium]|nr:hypothetical protein [Lachnospiraceae bacterium]
MLGGEYPAFEATYSEAAVKGIHLNPKRLSEEALLLCFGCSVSPIFNIKSGFYFGGTVKNELKLGMHPLHHGGAVYSQDPSAMLPVSGIDISPNWRVLDLCAAPGGKSSQIASQLSPQGFLLANEPNPSRNKILISNMERMGYPNVVVTKLTPQEIASYYPGYFHMVLVDAPCSGEGMFRKYPESIHEWSPENVLLCQQRQKEILSHAVNTLLPGGILVYSTCTYSVEENEDIVRWLLQEYSLEPYDIPEQIRSVTAPAFGEEISCCRRSYPHLFQGEGQFMAYFRKTGTLPDATDSQPVKPSLALRKISSKNMSLIQETFTDHFDLSEISFYEHQDKIIALPKDYHVQLPPHGITLCGVTAGMMEKNRFTPHHHFFHAYGNLCRNTLFLMPEDSRIIQYLSGQEITDDSVSKGYGVICCEGCPLGGFKASNGRLKNHYPKALRNL